MSTNTELRRSGSAAPAAMHAALNGPPTGPLAVELAGEDARLVRVMSDCHRVSAHEILAAALRKAEATDPDIFHLYITGELPLT